jgi:hypothetical protein
MQRLVRVLAVVVVALALPWLAPIRSEAGEVRINTDALNRPNHSSPPPARTPSVLRGGDPGIDRHDGRGRWHGGRDGHHHRPAVLLVAPARCWQPGYWVQQWVPQAYTYPTWVAGHWSQDGRWVEGHYVPYVHHAGYYQPYWVDGYWVSC